MPITDKDLLKRSSAALLLGARESSSSVPYDELGYAPRFEDNLMGGLPLVEIIGDLDAGAGCELDGKLRAAHSSAALAVNTFGPWRNNPSTFRIRGIAHFRAIRFEATCPTGLNGTPPHLDLLAEGQVPVGIESKCTEWMEAKPAKFRPSYDTLGRSHGQSPWFEQIKELRTHPDRYKHLDAAQLVKHALGLLTVYGNREVRLLYLYWEPRNADLWQECRLHREEASELAAKVSRSNVQLVPMSYPELWEEWGCGNPTAHLHYLRSRYDREA